MSRGTDLLASLGDRLSAIRGRMTVDAGMDKVTWLRVGGPADILFQPRHLVGSAKDIAHPFRSKKFQRGPYGEECSTAQTEKKECEIEARVEGHLWIPKLKSIELAFSHYRRECGSKSGERSIFEPPHDPCV